jgi:hypothetical protein
MRTVTDPLARARIHLPADVEPFDRCIATVASPGYERWLAGLAGSIAAYAGPQPATLAVFGLGRDDAELAHMAGVAADHGAMFIACEPLRPLNPTSKAILYAAARVIAARRFICLDADMVVFADLEPVFSALDVLAPDRILVCREANDRRYTDLGHILDTAYRGGSPNFFDPRGPVGRYPLVVNDGLFAGRAEALLALDRAVRALPDAIDWVDVDPAIDWRNQFVFNVALATLDAGVELDPTWNVQLHAQEVEAAGDPDRPRAQWRDTQARILHFCAPAKAKYPELRDWAVR